MGDSHPELRVGWVELVTGTLPGKAPNRAELTKAGRTTKLQKLMPARRLSEVASSLQSL